MVKPSGAESVEDLSVLLQKIAKSADDDSNKVKEPGATLKQVKDVVNVVLTSLYASAMKEEEVETEVERRPGSSCSFEEEVTSEVEEVVSEEETTEEEVVSEEETSEDEVVVEYNVEEDVENTTSRRKNSPKSLERRARPFSELLSTLFQRNPDFSRRAVWYCTCRRS